MQLKSSEIDFSELLLMTNFKFYFIYDLNNYFQNSFSLSFGRLANKYSKKAAFSISEPGEVIYIKNSHIYIFTEKLLLLSSAFSS